VVGGHGITLLLTSSIIEKYNIPTVNDDVWGAVMELSGKVAIVTGSGRGLGLAYARRLASLGAAVVVNDVAPDVAEAAAEQVRAAGGKAVAVAAAVGGT
jgi:S-adenosylhomocysteine hydrolase